MGREHEDRPEVQSVVDELKRAMLAVNVRLKQLDAGYVFQWPEVVQDDPDRPVEPPDPPQPAATTGSVCPNCQSPNVQRMGGCETCMDCGESVGGCG